MPDKISSEQKAHDLAIAYAIYLSSIEGKMLTSNPFMNTTKILTRILSLS